MIEFTGHLQVVTTNNYKTIAISTLYKITLSIFQPAVSSLIVAWQRLLTMVTPLLPYSSPLWTAAPSQLPSLASVVFLITPLHGPSRKHRFQQYLYCCILIRCLGTVFTKPLPRNGSTRYSIYHRAVRWMTYWRYFGRKWSWPIRSSIPVSA
jgi:hypothetical protein